MGDVVNLRRVRKAKARRDAETTAAENRARFGQTKAEKSLRKAGDDLAARRLDGHRLASPDEPSDDGRADDGRADDGRADDGRA